MNNNNLVNSKDFVEQVNKEFTELKSIFNERNESYKQNFVLISEILNVLYPNGVSKEVLGSPVFPLLVLKLVKLTRFVQSDFLSTDSIEDDANYSILISAFQRLKSASDLQATEKKNDGLSDDDLEFINALSKFPNN